MSDRSLVMTFLPPRKVERRYFVGCKKDGPIQMGKRLDQAYHYEDTDVGRIEARIDALLLMTRGVTTISLHVVGVVASEEIGA